LSLKKKKGRGLPSVLSMIPLRRIIKKKEERKRGRGEKGGRLVIPACLEKRKEGEGSSSKILEKGKKRGEETFCAIFAEERGKGEGDPRKDGIEGRGVQLFSNEWTLRCEEKEEKKKREDEES